MLEIIKTKNSHRNEKCLLWALVDWTQLMKIFVLKGVSVEFLKTEEEKTTHNGIEYA